MSNYKLVRKQITVSLEGEDGTEKTYTVRELTGKGRDRYLKELAARCRYGADGKIVGITSMEGLQILLLSLTLHSPEGKLVPDATIGEWPATTVEGLFKESQTLSALTMDEETKVGNG